MIGDGGDRAPDLIHPIIGFRRWKLKDGLLCSPFITDCLWDEPDMEAGCFTHGGDAKHKHRAPDKDCACGLYAYYEPDYLPIATADIPGAVAVSGRIQVHEDGVRAQRVKIVALGYAKTISDTADHIAAIEEKNARLKEIAADWGIPLVPDRELQELAAQYGAPMPEQIIKRVKEKNAAQRKAFQERAQAARKAREAERAKNEGRQPLPPNWFDFLKGLFGG